VGHNKVQGPLLFDSDNMQSVLPILPSNSRGKVTGSFGSGLRPAEGSWSGLEPWRTVDLLEGWRLVQPDTVAGKGEITQGESPFVW
jgi:hypothetical protein